MSITLLELRTQARQMADMVDNEFVSDAELNNYVNFAISELHDILIQSYGSDYFLNSFEGTTVSGQVDYPLPSDFYKLMGVDIKLGAQSWFTIDPFNFNERNKYEEFGSWTVDGISNIRYRVMGNNIKLTPTPDSATPYRLWYVPVATKLVADTDVYDDINQFSDFVIITAAMKMVAKEESDTSVLMSERNRIEEKIKQASQNRDIGSSEAISDVFAEDTAINWFISQG